MARLSDQALYRAYLNEAKILKQQEKRLAQRRQALARLVSQLPGNLQHQLACAEASMENDSET